MVVAMTASLLVEQFMTRKVRSIEPGATLSQAHHILREHSFSCLPVVEEGRVLGVLSRTDLLKIGQPERRGPAQKALLSLPDKRVVDAMKTEPVCVTPTTTVAAASALMVARHIHRVLVIDKGELTGVFSTRDVMDVLQAHKVRSPISDYMSTPVLGVGVDATIDRATEQLQSTGVSGLVVLEDEFPVGLFTQVEALQSAAEPATTRVEEAMNYALLCLDLRTSMHRAAAQARATRARRVIAVEHRRIWGILTGLDFARAATSLP